MIGSRSPRTLRTLAATLGIFLLGGGNLEWAHQAAAQDDRDFMRVRMPGKSYAGELPPLTERQMMQRDRLRKDLAKLAGDIGERNTQHPRQYALAAQWIEQNLITAGLQVVRQTYPFRGRNCVNLESELTGKQHSDEIIILGAHYDSVAGTVGANDNGSGVVALLALARSLAKDRPGRTLRFVFFANEEPPYFQTESMGSMVYAKRCHQRDENIVGMLSVETAGYFSDEKESQHYPPPFNLLYPSTGNFIAFVGNTRSGDLVKSCVAAFRNGVKFPSEGGALPASIEGIGWSDHWSFWQYGYPALMVTDTAPFRYPHYHLATDTPDKVDYGRLARVVTGLEAVVHVLANPQQDDNDPE